MKIKKHGHFNHKYSGECRNCGCVVECDKSETKTLIDRDTLPGTATQYVDCPECGTKFLWVKAWIIRDNKTADRAHKEDGR
jgi:hypothetical protein